MISWYRPPYKNFLVILSIPESYYRSTDIEYYGKLQELSDMAGTDFFRTHRAYLVHFKYVEKYDATCVTMKNGTALIAKKNYPEFVRRYLKYNQRKGNEVR